MLTSYNKFHPNNFFLYKSQVYQKKITNQCGPNESGSSGPDGKTQHFEWNPKFVKKSPFFNRRKSLKVAKFERKSRWFFIQAKKSGFVSDDLDIYTHYSVYKTILMQFLVILQFDTHLTDLLRITRIRCEKLTQRFDRSHVG